MAEAEQLHRGSQEQQRPPRPRNISREEALRLQGYKHACHVLLYGPSPAKLFGRIPIKHVLLVSGVGEERRGGPLGFVEPKDSTMEEPQSGAAGGAGLDAQLGVVTQEDFRRAKVRDYPQKAVTNTFKQAVNLDDIERIEAEAMNAKDHGLEVMRFESACPSQLRDGVGGLPAFGQQLHWKLQEPAPVCCAG
ncbi:hypothetical protein FKM82_005669, partial [Ascaphus truei]